MSDTVQLAIVTGVIAIATLVIRAIIDAHAKRATQKLEAVEMKIDGRLTQLLEMTKTAYLAEGKEQGKAEEKAQEKEKQSEVSAHVTSEATDLKITGGEMKITTESKKKK